METRLFANYGFTCFQTPGSRDVAKKKYSFRCAISAKNPNDGEILLSRIEPENAIARPQRNYFGNQLIGFVTFGDSRPQLRPKNAPRA